MVKNQNLKCKRRNTFETLMIMIIPFFLTCCSQERSAHLREDERRDLIAIETFKPHYEAALEILDSRVVNPSRDEEHYLYPKYLAQPLGETSEINEALSDLWINAPHAKNITIRLIPRSDQKLISYKIVPKTQLRSLIPYEQLLAQKVDEDTYQIPLYHYDVKFVRLQIKKNDYGEKTDRYEQIETSLKEAEYIKINFHSASKILALDSFAKSHLSVINKEELIEKVIDLDTIVDKSNNNEQEAPSKLQQLLNKALEDFKDSNKLGLDKFNEFIRPNQMVILPQTLNGENSLAFYKLVPKHDVERLPQTQRIRMFNHHTYGQLVELFRYKATFTTPEVELNEQNLPTTKLNLPAINIPTATHVIVDLASKNRQYPPGLAKDEDQKLVQLKDLQHGPRFQAEVKKDSQNNVTFQLNDQGPLAKQFSLLFKNYKSNLTSSMLKPSEQILVKLGSDGQLRFFLVINQETYEQLDLTHRRLVINHEAEQLLPLFYHQGKFVNIGEKVNHLGQRDQALDIIQVPAHDANHFMLGAVNDIKTPGVAKRAPDLMEKSAFDTQALHLYVPSTHGTPRIVTGITPFMQGQGKLVKIQFSEENLNIYEIDLEDRFAQKPANNHPVLTIPIKHVDYKLKENDNGLEDLTEEEDDTKSWNEKRYFIPQFTSTKVNEINHLDLFATPDKQCFSNESTQKTHVEALPGVFNFEIEKTYKVNDINRCGQILARSVHGDLEEGLKSGSFNVRFFYSIVRLSDLASDNYEKVVYPEKDQKVFGFFSTTNKGLNPNLDQFRKNIEYYLARWNPNNPDIVYHLSSRYFRPENKIFLNATYKLVKNINIGLKKAQAPIQIKLIPEQGEPVPFTEEEIEKGEDRVGDLRKNMIVLIDDPLATGLLGYGPTIPNPLTGEIINGRVNMYSATITSAIRRIYYGVLHDYNQKVVNQRKNKKSVVDPKGSSDLDTQLANVGQKPSRSNYTTTPLANNNTYTNPNYSDIDFGKNFKKAPVDFMKFFRKGFDRLQYQMKDVLHHEQNELQKQFIKMFDDEDHRLKKLAKQDEMDRLLARNNVYSSQMAPFLKPEYFIFEDYAKKSDFLDKNGLMKPWEDLTDKLRSKITKKLAIHVYGATFTHEFGHNLGLRHNFHGNYDKENFYTKEEAKELGLKDAPIYSSIMDYGYNFLNELPVLGKYDIAALKFGYARKVDTTYQGKVHEVTLPGTLKDLLDEYEKERYQKSKEVMGSNRKLTIEELAKLDQKEREKYGDHNAAILEFVQNLKDIKRYEYCTDEDTNYSATCKRFIEGTNFAEVMNHYEDSYHKDYDLSNFRDHRNSFHDYDRFHYLYRIYTKFAYVRQIYLTYFYMKSKLPEEIVDGDCPDYIKKVHPRLCRQVKGLREAAEHSGRFLLDIIKTPDHQCIIDRHGYIDERKEMITKLELRAIFNKMLEDTPDQSLEKEMPHSCFDSRVVEFLKEKDMKVIAETGKILNDISNPFHQNTNELFARGTWLDKVLATFLFSAQIDAQIFLYDGGHRVNASFNKQSDLKYQLFDLFNHILLGSPLEYPIMQRDQAGTLSPSDVGVKRDIIIEGGYYNVAGFLGLGGGPFNLNKYLMRVIAYLTDITNFDDDINLTRHSDIFKVIRVNPFQDDIFRHKDSEDYVTYKDSFTKLIYAAQKENNYAFQILSNLNEMTEYRKMSDDFEGGLPSIIFHQDDNKTDQLNKDKLRHIFWAYLFKKGNNLGGIPKKITNSHLKEFVQDVEADDIKSVYNSRSKGLPLDPELYNDEKHSLRYQGLLSDLNDKVSLEQLKLILKLNIAFHSSLLETYKNSEVGSSLLADDAYEHFNVDLMKELLEHKLRNSSKIEGLKAKLSANEKRIAELKEERGIKPKNTEETELENKNKDFVDKIQKFKKLDSKFKKQMIEKYPDPYKKDPPQNLNAQVPAMSKYENQLIGFYLYSVDEMNTYIALKEGKLPNSTLSEVISDWNEFADFLRKDIRFLGYSLGIKDYNGYSTFLRESLEYLVPYKE